MSRKILLNKKPFGRFVISQEAFHSLVQRDSLKISRGVSNMIKTMNLKDFNKIHGLDWSSSDLFFTEKIGDYDFHAALPICKRMETVYYFYDSVETNGLTNTRYDFKMVRLFKEMKDRFESEYLSCVIVSVPFLEGLQIYKNEQGIENYKYQ